jgi:integrase
MTAKRRHFGNVRRLASGQYQASYWYDGRRHIAPQTFTQRADANAFLDAASAAIRRGHWIDPELGRISFARYADLWLAQRTDIRPRTREQYELLIENKLKPAFGQRELAKITPLHVRSWYADIAAKTPGSARSAYRLLKAIFNTAIVDDLIVKNPCRVKGGGTDRVTDRRIPNVDQVGALTQSMPEQYRAAVTLAAWGTLRRGEVLGLNRQDIDLRAGTVLVERSLHEFYDGTLELGPTKNGDPRKVYMPSSVMPALEDHLRRFVGPESDAPLFLGATGLRLRPSNFWVIYETARRRAGLTWVRFHDLRHFAATMCASTGASTKEIMSRGGWKSVAMVVRYEHASEERDALLAQVLNQLAESPKVVPIKSASPADRARSARDKDVGEAEVVDLPPLTSENEEKCSGGEIRTHNLAVNSRLLCH